MTSLTGPALPSVHRSLTHVKTADARYWITPIGFTMTRMRRGKRRPSTIRNCRTFAREIWPLLNAYSG